jgi:hypothetical protein
MTNLQKLPTDEDAHRAKIEEALDAYEVTAAYARQIAEITTNECNRMLGLKPITAADLPLFEALLKAALKRQGENRPNPEDL